MGDRVKIGFSLNLPQRVDSFQFEELIAVMPVVRPRHTDESEEAHAFRVHDELLGRERQIHDALEAYRLRHPRHQRVNADEWFRLDDAVLHVLAAHGAIIARLRPAGAPLPCRIGALPTSPPNPKPVGRPVQESIAGPLADSGRARFDRAVQELLAAADAL